MSVIIAYHTHDANGVAIAPTSKQRKEGMRLLGIRIRNETNAAANQNDYAAGLAKAIDYLLTGGGGTGTYRVSYQQVLGDAELDITSAAPTGSTVQCGLTGGGPHLILNVQMDNPNQARRMEVVFPRPSERHSYVYISDAADDVNELSDLEAWDYLVSFKFLGRCV